MSEETCKEPLHTDFARQIIERLGGETITLCYQCGTCAASCPVAKTTDKYNPREIIRLALLGLKREVLTGQAIWLCSSCYQCQERCPQKVEVADVIYALRNMAISEGNIPKVYSEFAAAMLNEGKIVPMSKFLEKKRVESGLPQLKPVDVEAIRKILSATGFDKIQYKKSEAQ